MKLQNVPKKVMGAFLTISMSLGGVVTRVLADDYTSFLDDDSSHTLDAVTSTVKGLAAEATSIIKYGAIFVLVVGLIIAAVQLGSGNAQKKEGAKSRLVMLILGLILVFAAAGVLIFSRNLGDNFASALQTAGTTPTPGP
jgi:hypothetical protein